MSDRVLYHNPRCSKSRAALALLEKRGVELRVREYLEQPLARRELAALARKLDLPPRDWVRPREPAFLASGLDLDAEPDALLDLMAEQPIVMERPIFSVGERAVVGRPPERVLELL